jgi:DNA-binding MarR family transcriptional regulator
LRSSIAPLQWESFYESFFDWGRLYRRLSAQIERRLPENLGKPTERRVLSELNRLSLRSDSAIRTELGLQKSPASLALKSLRSQGMIQSTAQSSSSKVRLHSLTLKGRDRANLVERLYQDELRACFDLLPLSEQLFLAKVVGAKLVRELRPSRTSITVRSFEASDLEWLLTEISHEASKSVGTTRRVLQAIQRFLDFDLDLRLGWIAQSNGKPVGVCLSVLSADAMSAEILELRTTPGCQGLGVEAKLVRAISASATRLSLNSVFLKNSRTAGLTDILVRNGFVQRTSNNESLGDPAVGTRLELTILASVP